MIIDKELTGPQGEMFKMRENKIAFPLFVGGYGCGKSEILVVNAIRDVMSFRGCYVGCYAPTHDLLDLNLVPRIEVELDKMGIKHKMNHAKHIMNIQGHRKIIFRSMDNPARIVAYEVYASHVDEADLMNTAKKGEEAWNRIIARNRQKRMKRSGKKKHKRHFNISSAYTTPEGFKFTYNRWSKKPGKGYKYVQAPTTSNWNLDESFITNLEDTYTPEQCKAYLMGYWTNIFTGNVYSYFNRKQHHTDRQLKAGEPIMVSCDFNYGGSCASIYVPLTVAEKEKINILKYLKRHTLANGQMEKRHLKEIIRLKEEVGLIMVKDFVSQDTEQMIQTLQSDYSGRQIEMYPDATGNKNSSNASPSDIAMLKQANFLIKAHGTNPRIVDRINAVQRLLYNDLFKINTLICQKTTEAMEEHAYSDITGLPEKIAGPATIDDHNDSMGYCPAFKFPIKKTTTTLREV